MPGRTAVMGSHGGTGEMVTPSEPNLKWTGLLTLASAAGSTKNTRGVADAARAAGGVLAGAGVDSAGLAGSEELHAASTSAPARAANPAKEVRSFMVRLLNQQVRARKKTAPILVQATSGMQDSGREFLRSRPRKRCLFSIFSKVRPRHAACPFSEGRRATP